VNALSWNHWDIHPSVAIGLVLLGGLYVYLGGAQARRWQIAGFVSALLVVFVCLNGPLHNLSDNYLFSAHMVQHLLLTLLFPPLLLFGIPQTVARRLVGNGWRLRMARFITKPLVAAGLFTAPIVLWHVPAYYEAALRNHDLHIVQHLVFITTAVVMWAPVLSPLPEVPRLPYPGQMVYLFLLGMPMSVTGALISLSDRVLYPFYAAAPRVWGGGGGLDAMADQQIGGLMMWVPGSLALWGAMTVIWFRWARWSERGAEDSAVPVEAYSPSAVSPSG
jgi:putative membrane protein